MIISFSLLRNKFQLKVLHAEGIRFVILKVNAVN